MQFISMARFDFLAQARGCLLRHTHRDPRLILRQEFVGGLRRLRRWLRRKAPGDLFVQKGLIAHYQHCRNNHNSKQRYNNAPGDTDLRHHKDAQESKQDS